MGIALLAVPLRIFAQQVNSAPVIAVTAEIPDAPQPQFEVAELSGQQDSSPAPKPATEGNSSSQTAPQQPDAKSKRDLAEEQLKKQEQQRVFGVMATFNTTGNKDALPLSSTQKFQLFFKSATDPWPFGLAGVISGIGQADNSYPEWGQGAQGYAKRFGAAYSDAFIGNFFGNAVLPSLLHEDPRYFQKGTGTFTRRLLWAASSTVWCRRDNGRWGPNYANVGGNLIGAAIARAYYPPSERDVADVLTDGVTVSVEGIAGAEIIEFWPDIARQMKKKRAEKRARQAAQKDSASQPAATH